MGFSPRRGLWQTESGWHHGEVTLLITISEIAQGQGVLFHASNDTSVAAMYHEKGEMMRRFPNLSQWYFAVIDMVDVAHLDADFLGIEKMVNQDLRLAKIFRPGFLVVAIASSELPYGIARMWQGISDMTGWKSEVVRNRVAAERWIQINMLADFGIELPPLDLQTASAGTNG